VDRLLRLDEFQKFNAGEFINEIPAMKQVCFNTNFFSALSRCRRLLRIPEVNQERFLPVTFLFPQEQVRLKAYHRMIKEGKQPHSSDTETQWADSSRSSGTNSPQERFGDDLIWIVKPHHVLIHCDFFQRIQNSALIWPAECRVNLCDLSEISLAGKTVQNYKDFTSDNLECDSNDSHGFAI
jgi:hypothetical protein